MFINNLDPTLLSIGPFEIRYYGIVYVIGFLLVYYILNLYRKKGKLDLTSDDIDNYILYLMIGVILGARLVHMFFTDPGYYLSNPINMLKIWEGGVAFHGGLLGAIIVSYYFAKKKNIPFLKLADIIVLPAAFVLALGRIANFINGELYGTITNVSWCVKFQAADGCRHPSQLYAALKRFIIFGIIYALSRKEHKDGFLFWTFIVLIAIGRLIVDLYRETFRIIGLSVGQWFSVIMIAIGIYVLVKYYRK
jgi:phosphatidylglycerol:prolipoprotein diacylglycerol transferase